MIRPRLFPSTLAPFLVCAAAFALCGCRASRPGITPPFAETPAVYTENRVFYVEPPPTKSDTEKDTTRRRLYQPYELSFFPPTQSGQTEAPVDTMSVRNGDPLSVIVQGVRLPDDMGTQFQQTTFDIAVMLDVMSGTSATEDRSLVVWYQRDVPPGQLLNFRDLLVYYDPAWDATFAPYFRIRVLDVRSLAEDTTMTNTLRSIGNLSLTLGGIMPSPIIPGVSIAMEAATQLMQRPGKRVLMDFTVQFYSEEQRRGAGGELSQLRKGSWIVLGRPSADFAMEYAVAPKPVLMPTEPAESGMLRAPVPSDFWRRTLYVDQQTGQVHDTSAGLMHVPYVAVTISTAHSQVPSIVTRRSEELIRLLTSAEGRGGTTDLENQSKQLTSSVLTYVAERRLLRNRSLSDVEGVMNLFKRHIAAVQSPEDASPADLLSNESERQLMLLVNRILPNGMNLATAEDAINWWNSVSKLPTLKIKETSESPVGFTLQVPPENAP